MTKYNEIRQKIVFSVAETCIDDKSYEETDRNELKKTLEACLSNMNKYYELNVKQQHLIKEFEKNNPDITEELNKLGEEIKTITATLSTHEALLALKFYEYYETEPITRDLLTRVENDIEVYNSKMEVAKDDSKLKEMRSEYDKVFTAYTFASQDKDYDMVQIQNNKAYQSNIKHITENMREENDKMIEIKNKITSSDVYKKAFDEYTKDAREEQKEYISVSEVVNFSQDENLLSLYYQYLTEKDKYHNSITLEHIINYKHKDNKDTDVKKLKEDYNKYI
jgi:hypothetical protein